MLNVLLPEEDALIIFEGDCLNLSVYNPSEGLQSLLQKIAISEGMS